MVDALFGEKVEEEDGGGLGVEVAVHADEVDDVILFVEGVGVADEVERAEAEDALLKEFAADHFGDVGGVHLQNGALGVGVAEVDERPGGDLVVGAQGGDRAVRLDENDDSEGLDLVEPDRGHLLEERAPALHGYLL